MSAPISRTSTALTTSWTKVVNGSGGTIVSVQICNQGSDSVYFAMVVTGATAPTTAADRGGVIPVDSTQPFTNMGGCDVYARAASGTATVMTEVYGD